MSFHILEPQLSTDGDLPTVGLPNFTIKELLDAIPYVSKYFLMPIQLFSYRRSRVLTFFIQ